VWKSMTVWSRSPGPSAAGGKRHAAAEAAHRVRGVLNVANDIMVKTPGTPGRTDTEVARAVRNALVWDVFVPDKRIRSTVSDGVVTLDGDVDTQAEVEDAERAVRNLAGVRAVMSLIEDKASNVDPASLRKAVDQALERQAERESRRVHFEVHDGIVTVSGTVRTWAERDAVIGAAKGTPGVRRVEDKLRIEPSF
jgi:osmotically-inducible protein OsmY